MLHASCGVGNGGAWRGGVPWKGPARVELAEEGGDHPWMERLPFPARPIKREGEEGGVIHLYIPYLLHLFSASAGDAEEKSLGPAPGLLLGVIVATCWCWCLGSEPGPWRGKSFGIFDARLGVGMAMGRVWGG